MKTRERTVAVFEVLYMCAGPGPFGDGIDIARFLSDSDAAAFCAGKRYLQYAAQPLRTDVPRGTARRWGLM